MCVPRLVFTWCWWVKSIGGEEGDYTDTALLLSGSFFMQLNIGELFQCFIVHILGGGGRGKSKCFLKKNVCGSQSVFQPTPLALQTGSPIHAIACVDWLACLGIQTTRMEWYAITYDVWSEVSYCHRA